MGSAIHPWGQQTLSNPSTRKRTPSMRPYIRKRRRQTQPPPISLTPRLWKGATVASSIATALPKTDANELFFPHWASPSFPPYTCTVLTLRTLLLLFCPVSLLKPPAKKGKRRRSNTPHIDSTQPSSNPRPKTIGEETLFVFLEKCFNTLFIILCLVAW